MNNNNLFSAIGKGAKRLDPTPHLPVYRRHVIVDHMRKVVCIEVMANIFTKSLNQVEFSRIKNGHWHEYVPKDHIPAISECIAQGFTVEPVYLIGMESEDYRVIQIVGLQEGKKDVFNKM